MTPEQIAADIVRPHARGVFLRLDHGPTGEWHLAAPEGWTGPVMAEALRRAMVYGIRQWLAGQGFQIPADAQITSVRQTVATNPAPIGMTPTLTCPACGMAHPYDQFHDCRGSIAGTGQLEADVEPTTITKVITPTPEEVASWEEPAPNPFDPAATRTPKE